MKNRKRLAGLLALSMILLTLGCSDKSSTNPVPAELVGTWWFLTASFDGTPVASYNEVANDQDAVDGSVTFVTNGTWHGDEYDGSQTVVFTQSGTFFATADSLTLILTMFGGIPQNPPDTDKVAYTIAGDLFTITSTEEIMGTPHDLLVTYEKE